MLPAEGAERSSVVLPTVLCSSTLLSLTNFVVAAESHAVDMPVASNGMPGERFSPRANAITEGFDAAATQRLAVSATCECCWLIPGTALELNGIHSPKVLPLPPEMEVFVMPPCVGSRWLNPPPRCQAKYGLGPTTAPPVSQEPGCCLSLCSHAVAIAGRRCARTENKTHIQTNGTLCGLCPAGF